MNKLTKHIKQKIQAYPLIFKSRLHVLVHMYITSGTGYKWNNEGMLLPQNESKDEPKNQDDAIEKIRKYYYKQKESGPPSTLDFLKERWNSDLYKKVKTLRWRVFHAEELAIGDFNKKPEEKIIWTGNKEFSPICNIPDKIDDSFRKGAIEIIEAKLNHPNWFKEHHTLINDVECKEILNKLKLNDT